MHEYRDIITLNRNSRGCYILDTVKGCSALKHKADGCYGDCYANNIATRYGFDFSNPIKRDFYKQEGQLYFSGFQDTKHESKIINQIKEIEMPFIRIGEMGDPSEDWEHTINICEKISVAKKPIVIITKHWKKLSAIELNRISKLNICVNSSISALDNDIEIGYRLKQYNVLKDYCNSVLRVVTCDFIDKKKKDKQEELLGNEKVVDTVFRPTSNNKLIKNGIIRTEKVKFLRATMLASMHDKSIFFGRCEHCPEMCGINL